MFGKLMLLGAGAVGYVLGAKAGRERYEQIAQKAQQLRNNPAVQEKVEQARSTAKDAAETAAGKVREQTSGEGGDEGSTETSATPMSSDASTTTYPAAPGSATGESPFGSGSQPT